LWQTERFERKFPLPEGVEDQALALLRAYGVPDPEHPQGVINSAYFDTPELESYLDALNGDYRKRKIRARWYGEPPYDDGVDLYVECKSKRRFMSSKARVPHPVAGTALRDEAIGQSRSNLQIQPLLQSLGDSTTTWLRPIIHIRYDRHRFIDPSVGTPISLDLSIRSRLLDNSLGVSPGWLVLRNAVIEVKGNMTSLPPSLHALRRQMPAWTSFSKYTRCLDSHLERPGSVGGRTAL
jgi:hypothetical protein